MSRSPGSSVRTAFSPSGPTAWAKTRPTGFSAVPPPGPATPVTATPTSAPSRSRTPVRHRRCDLGRHRAVLFDHARRDAEARLLHLVGVRDDRADEDVARAGNGGQPRSDHASGARLRGRELQAARAAEVEDDLRDRALVLAEEVRGELRHGATRRRARRAAPRPDRRRGRRGSRTRGRRSSPPLRRPHRPPSASASATADSGVPKKRST